MTTPSVEDIDKLIAYYTEPQPRSRAVATADVLAALGLARRAAIYREACSKEVVVLPGALPGEYAKAVWRTDEANRALLADPSDTGEHTDG